MWRHTMTSFIFISPIIFTNSVEAVFSAETRHVQIDLLDISTLYRHVVSYFIRCNRTEYLRDTAIFAKSRLYLYANVSVKLSNVLYARGGAGTDGRREPYKISKTNPSFTVYTRVSHTVVPSTVEERRSFTIDKIKISRRSSYCLVVSLFPSPLFFIFSSRSYVLHIHTRIHTLAFLFVSHEFKIISMREREREKGPSLSLFISLK